MREYSFGPSPGDFFSRNYTVWECSFRDGKNKPIMMQKNLPSMAHIGIFITHFINQFGCTKQIGVHTPYAEQSIDAIDWCINESALDKLLQCNLKKRFQDDDWDHLDITDHDWDVEDCVRRVVMQQLRHYASAAEHIPAIRWNEIEHRPIGRTPQTSGGAAAAGGGGGGN
jgi:hypothetical protein